MAKPAEKPEEKPAVVPPVVPEEKLSASVRAELSAEDSDLTPAPVVEAAPAAPAPAATPAGAPVAAAPTAAQKEAVGDALEEALPTLSPKQIAALANDPSVVAAVLQGNIAATTLNELFNEVLQEKEQETVQKGEREKRTATVSEALRLGEEDGDWSEFGKLSYEQAKRNQAAKAQSVDEEKVFEAAKGVVMGDLDSAVEDVYGDVLSALTPEESAELDRGRYRSDGEFMAAVFRKLDAKRVELVRSGVADEQSDEATKIATAAGTVRAKGGIGALPGGSGTETRGGSIGDLIREGFKDDPRLSDESD